MLVHVNKAFFKQNFKIIPEQCENIWEKMRNKNETENRDMEEEEEEEEDEKDKT